MDSPSSQRRASVRRVAQLVNPSVVGDDSLLREIVHGQASRLMPQSLLRNVA